MAGTFDALQRSGAVGMTMKGQRLLLTSGEAAQMLGIGRSTFWAKVKSQELPQPLKIGGATRWRAEEIQAIGATPTALPASPTRPAKPQKYMAHALVKPQKTEHQLAQWAAYEALCAQRVKEAKARKALGDLAATRQQGVDDIQHTAACFQRAEELRRFAMTVIARVDPTAGPEVRQRANEWRDRVLKLADELDPIAKILATFGTPLP